MTDVFNLFAVVEPLLGMTPRIWYSFPLIIAVSIAYGATRHEQATEIMIHACRSAIWILGFMAVIFFLIWVSGFWN